MSLSNVFRLVGVGDDNTPVKSKALAKEKRLFLILRIICTAKFKGKGGERREEEGRDTGRLSRQFMTEVGG